jgi:TatA/E family protein of Tat protein translocase
MELILILIVALMVFGPDKLPQIGAKLGRGMREMRKATRAISDEINATRDAVTNPAKELAEPFQDVADAAKAVGSMAAVARNPGQAMKDSVLKELNRPPAEAPAAGEDSGEQNTIAPPAAVQAAAATAAAQPEALALPEPEAEAAPALPEPEETAALPAPEALPALPEPEPTPALPAPEPPAGEAPLPDAGAAPSELTAAAPPGDELPPADQPVAKKRKPRAKKTPPPSGEESAAGEQ